MPTSPSRMPALRRRVAAACALVLLTALLAVTAPASSEAAATRTKLTLSAPTSVTSGDDVSLKGKLTAKGAAIQGMKVTLMGRPPGGTWRKVATKRTTKKGAYAVSVPAVTTTTEFRARFKANSPWRASDSVVRRVTVPTTTPTPTPTPAPTATPTPTPTPTATTTPTSTSTPTPVEVTIQTSFLPTANEGNAYTADLEATGGAAPYTWAVTAGTLPSGLSLSATGTIAGTPTSTGVHDFTVRATEAGGVLATAELSIFVVAGTFEITTASLPNGVQGQPYNAQLATRHAGGTVTWQLTSGQSLPAGLTLSGTGLISGSPLQPGSSTFGVEAFDGTGSGAFREFTVVVSAAGQPVFADTALPAAQVGVGYAYVPRVVGGTGSYTWQITGGALPSGLTLNAATGLIAGTPTSVGTATPTLRASDSSGAGTRALPIEVTATTGWAQEAHDEGASASSPGDRTIAAGNVSQVAREWKLPRNSHAQAVADGVLFTGGLLPGSPVATGVTARDLASGQVLWTTPIPMEGGASRTCDRLAVSTTSVVCQHSSAMMAFSRSGNHDLLWDTAVTDPGSTFSDVALAGSRLVVLDATGVAAYDLGTGNRQWGRLLPESPRTLVVGSLVYTTDDGGELRSFNLASGSNGFAALNDVVHPYGAPTVVPGSGELVTRKDNTLTWRNPATGAVLRTWASTRGLFGEMSADAQRLYVPTADFDEFGGWFNTGVTAVRHSDASERWDMTTPFPVRSGTAVGGNVLWVHSSGLGNQRQPSYLDAVDAATGTELRTIEVPDTSFAAPLVAGGRVIVRLAFESEVYGVMAPPVSIGSQLLPTGWAGQPFTGQLQAAGGSSPYTWTLVSGALPAGMALAGNGAISGTPSGPGVASFTVRATDRVGMSRQRAVRIAVRASASAEWRTLAGGPGRTGAVLGQAGIDSESIASFGVRLGTAPVTAPSGLWPGFYSEEPIVVGDRVYGLGWDGKLRAWSTAPGLGKAPVATGSPTEGASFLGTPALDGSAASGTVYAVDSTGMLFALSASTLAEQWSVQLPGQSGDGRTTPLVLGGRVLVSLGQQVVAVSTTTHGIDWSAPLLNASAYDSFGLATDGSRVFGYDACDVIALNPGTGAEVWRRSLRWVGSDCYGTTSQYGGYQRVTPVVYDGVVYANNFGAGGGAFDAATGAVVWRNRLAADNATPLVSENWVVVTSQYESAIHVVDRLTGERVATTADSSMGSPTLVGDLLVLRTQDGRLQAFDLITLEPVWQSGTFGQGGTFGGVAVHGGRFYAYTVDGRVVGLGPP